MNLQLSVIVHVAFGDYIVDSSRLNLVLFPSITQRNNRDGMMRGLETEGIIEVQLTEDGSQTRFIFEQDGKPLWVSMPSHNLEAMLPIISKAVASIQSDDATGVVDVVGVDVGVDDANDLIIRLENTAGALMSFRLSREFAFSLSALLDKVLKRQSGSDQVH